MEITVGVQDEQEAVAVRMLVAERRRQDNKFGIQDHDPAWWMVIMGEEFGETCQAVCEYRWAEAAPDARDRMSRIEHAMEEASQVGAVAVAMIQAILRGVWVDEITTALPSDKRQVAIALNKGDEAIQYEPTYHHGEAERPPKSIRCAYIKADHDGDCEPRDIEATPAPTDTIEYFKCYHCNLDIEKDGESWKHVSTVKYIEWLEERVAASINKSVDQFDHVARYEPLCTAPGCGRDNANGTHDALQAAGHLSHAFTLTQNVEVPMLAEGVKTPNTKGGW